MLRPAEWILPASICEEAFEGLDIEADTVAVGTKEDALQAVCGADVVIVAGVPADAQLIAAMDRAQAICSFGHGFDGVDVDAATRAGILVCNTARVCHQEVANHAAAMILALNRRLLQADRAMKSGVWDRPALRPIGPLDGEVAGLIGMGAIGRSLANRLVAFGLHLRAYDPYVDGRAWREFRVEPAGSLTELMAASDYVSIQVPLNDSTRGMIGEAEFRAMKPGAYFVDCCRGGVVDEAALTRALREGRIAGAGVDVFEKEPTPPDNPLVHMGNVIATPHAGGESTVVGNVTNAMASEQAAAVLKGLWPSSAVNPEVRRSTRPPARS